MKMKFLVSLVVVLHVGHTHNIIIWFILQSEWEFFSFRFVTGLEIFYIGGNFFHKIIINGGNIYGDALLAEFVHQRENVLYCCLYICNTACCCCATK